MQPGTVYLSVLSAAGWPISATFEVSVDFTRLFPVTRVHFYRAVADWLKLKCMFKIS